MGGLFVPGQMLGARSRYEKQLEFFRATRDYREVCLMAANRGGKTLAGAYAVACHLSGLYPDWWDGRRFNHPISAWVAGKTYETTRDILQLTLLGEVTSIDGKKRMDGRGIIPGHLLGRNSWRSGIQDLIDTVAVKHVTGGNSFMGLKSTDQGRKAFEGTGRHVVLLDEEPPADVYNEALIRTATVNGIVMLTFTPLLGLSEVVLSFLPADQRPDI
jgi:phage terminase large subunit-like protein